MRRKDREITDSSSIEQILAKAKIMHVGFHDDEYPYVIAVHYGYRFTDEKLVLWFHGALQGHKLDLIRKDPRVCVELECDTESVDGGDIPCRYSAYYASIIARGKAIILENREDKKEGIRQLLLNQTGRNFEINDAMVQSVAVVRIDVLEYSAKAKRKI